MAQRTTFERNCLLTRSELRAASNTWAHVQACRVNSSPDVVHIAHSFPPAVVVVTARVPSPLASQLAIDNLQLLKINQPAEVEISVQCGIGWKFSEFFSEFCV